MIFSVEYVLLYYDSLMYYTIGGLNVNRNQAAPAGRIRKEPAAFAQDNQRKAGQPAQATVKRGGRIGIMTQRQATGQDETTGTGATAIKLVIYDLDGTLVDAFRDIANAVNHAMRLCDLNELPFEQIKSYVGDGVGALLSRALGDAHADRLEALMPLFLEHYRNHSSDFARLYPGVAETLTAIAGAGVRQAILTNKPQPVTDACCAKLGLDGLVDHIWGERSGVPRKPDPAAIEQVLRHWSVAPGECLMVGDGPAAFDVARNGGVRVAMVTWCLATPEQIAAMAPDAILERMEDLPALLG